MPFYEYECENCKFYAEVMQKITDAPLRKCPSCKKNALKKLVSAPVFRLKGGGWYETDFKSDQETKRNLAEKAEASESKPAESGAESKPAEGKAEAKADKADKADTKPTKPAAKPEAKPAARSSARKSAARKTPVHRPPKAKSRTRSARKGRR